MKVKITNYITKMKKKTLKIGDKLKIVKGGWGYEDFDWKNLDSVDDLVYTVEIKKIEKINLSLSEK